MTEKQRNSKLNTMKVLSIICLVVVIAMNMFSWVSIGGPSYAKEAILYELDFIGANLENDDALEMLQDELDDADIDLDVEDFVKDTKALFDPITDFEISPVDFVSITSGFNGLIDFMTDPEMEEYMGYSVMDDSDTAMGITVIRVMLTIEVLLFGLVVVLSILHIVFHIINRKGLGISVAIFTFLNMIYMAFIWLMVTAVMSDMGGYALITPAPFVALACAILACVFWGKARKYINMVKVEVPVQQPQAPGQPVAPTPAPQAPVQPAAPATKFCPNCGNQLSADAKFCAKCGTAQ